MSCDEAKKYLDAYVDGELEAGAMLRVENHLSRCETCGAVVAVKSRLKEELAELGQRRAPAHLRARVEKIARTGGRVRIILRAAPLAAAAAFAVFILWPMGPQAEEPMAAVVDDVVQRHVRDLPMEVQGPDPRSASSWFRGKVDFPVRAPALGLRNASFSGARLSNVRSHQAAHMLYDVDGHRVTVMIFNPEHTAFSGGERVSVGQRDVLIGQRNGYNVAIFIDGGMAYALSSDLSKRRLLELVRDL